MAIGTFALALATVWLAKRAHEEAQAVARQAEGAHRPLVLPLMGRAIDGISHLTIKNAGAGAAINVRGSLRWTETAGGSRSLYSK